MAKLVIVPRPGLEPQEVRLGDQPITLGREPENEVQLDGLEVSRRHCRIEPLSQGGYRIIDLGSKNGTFLNGRQISAMALDFDDQLRMGDSMAVYVEDHVPGREALAAVDGGTAWLPSTSEPSSSILTDDDGSDEMSTWRSGRREPPRTGGPHTRSSNRTYLKERLLRLGLLTQNIASAPDLSRLMDTILDEVLDFTGFERGLLLLGDDDDDGGARLKPVIGRYMDHENLEEAERTFSRSLVEEALRERRITFRTGLTSPSSDYSTRDSVVSMGLESALCIPLFIPQRVTARRPKEDRRKRSRRNRILGAIYLDSTTDIRRLDKADLQLLEAVAAQAAIALQNAHLHHQATTDPLTSLHNRGFLKQALEEELRHAKEAGDPLGVVILDLDHFKQVNDTYGHGVGDEVLKRVSQRIRRALRADDYAARWGGEEFLLVLPGSDLEGARTVAAKVAAAIKRAPIGEAELTVTASLGVASFPLHGDSGVQLIKRADQALYAAKAAGRDRTVAFSPELDQADHRLAPYEGLLDGDSARTQRNLKAIFDTIDLLRSKQQPQEILEGALDHVCDLTRARRAMLIVERADGTLQPVAARQQGRRLLEGPEGEFSHSTVRTALIERRSLCMLDTFGGERLTSSSIDRLGLNTVMCVPLLVGGEPLGVLYADDTVVSREFKEADLAHLEVIAYQLGTSLAANPGLYEAITGRRSDDPAEAARLRDEVQRLRAELEALRGPAPAPPGADGADGA